MCFLFIFVCLESFSECFWNVLHRKRYKYSVGWSENGIVVALLSRDGNGMGNHKTAMEENEKERR
jgi:hypothetical protein